MNTSAVTPRSPLSATLAILGASACFSAMGICLKAADQLSTWQVVFWRSIVVLVIATVLQARSGAAWWPGNPPRLILRCAVGLASMTCFFWSIKGLDLGTATAIQYLSPVFTVLLAVPILGERTGASGWFFVALAFGGVLLVVRPDGHWDVLPAVVGLAGAFFAGWVYVLVRQLRTSEPAVRIVWWFAVTSVLISAPFAFAVGLPPDGRHWLLALGIGLGATGGQLAMTQAYRMGEASHVGPLSYATVVFSALAGALLFDEVLTGWSLVGIAAIIGAGAALSAGLGKFRWPRRPVARA